MTEAEYKVNCALVQLAGLDRQTGMTPAEVVAALESQERRLEERERAAGLVPPKHCDGDGLCPACAGGGNGEITCKR